MKTIFITIFGGAIARNILRTDVLKILKSELKIILLVPNSKKEYYEKEFADKNIIIESFPGKIKKMDKLFFHLGFESLHTKTVTNRQKNYLKNTSDYKGYIIRRIFWFFGQFKLFREFLRGFYYIIPSKNFRELLRKYKPILVFAPNSISPEDIQLLKEAKKKNIKTLGMVKSWDSLTSKTFLAVKPDHLIAHNEIIKKEAEVFSDYPQSRVFVSGVPQFDIYFDKKNILSREEFFKKIKADPSKKLIFFCASGGWIAPTDGDIAQILDQAIRSQKIKIPTQVLLRPHPKYEVDSKVKEYSNIIIDYPGKHLGLGLGSWEFEEDDMLHLLNSLYHCDLMINTVSTVTIEACIFDKPVINIAFDGFQKKPFFESVARFYTSNHYSNIVRTGGVSVVHDKEEMVEAINSYFLKPDINNNGRAKIVKEQCQFIDGKSGERIGNFILNLTR
jgi:CDP-glycerol glycerophosphotransferase (TagB/SpsB family)